MPAPAAVVIDPQVGTPPPKPFASWCEWARDGYNNALDGLRAVSSGVKGYKIGTRATEYRAVSDQQAVVDEWRKLVEFYCGDLGLPPAITGRDTAVRVIPRDV